MSERVMARVVRLDEVKTHPNADALELAVVGGWQCVVKKGEYKTGDVAIFCEIDSWIPHTIAPFLTKDGQYPKVYNGVEGQKLRTIRLRSELSQGLILPIQSLSEYAKDFDSEGSPVWIDPVDYFNNGDDVTELLGIQKWEAPVNAQLAGISKGGFPSQFPKTDQERIQNLSRRLEKWLEQGLSFTVQEKLEGSSMTCYLLNGEFGVCSRNLNLKETEDNTFWKVARELDIENKMRNFFKSDTFDPNKPGGEFIDVAIQGELIGPGIEGNIYNLSEPTMRVFDIVFANKMSYADPETLKVWCDHMALENVPFLGTVKLGYKLGVNYAQDVQDFIEMAEGKSELNPKQEREGLVFKCNEDPSITFKAISNKYLLGQKE